MRVYKSLLIATAVAALLSACGGGGGGGGGSTGSVVTAPVVNPVLTFSTGLITKSQNADSTGREAASVTKTFGEYTFSTNIWNPRLATAYSFNQSGTVDTGTQPQVASTAISWDVSTTASEGVVGYPGFIYGKHPGFATSTTTQLPVQASAISTLKTTGTAKTVCLTVCMYNTMYDVFLMGTPNSTSSDIGTEISIHSDVSYPHNLAAADGQFVYNNIVYSIYHNSFGSTWNTIMYMPPFGTPITNISTDIKAFLQDAANRGYIKMSDYLVSIEFGTEVTYGSGTTTVTNFSVTR